MIKLKVKEVKITIFEKVKVAEGLEEETDRLWELQK